VTDTDSVTDLVTGWLKYDSKYVTDYLHNCVQTEKPIEYEVISGLAG
jgi:hypothetical protein